MVGEASVRLSTSIRSHVLLRVLGWPISWLGPNPRDFLWLASLNYMACQVAYLERASPTTDPYKCFVCKARFFDHLLKN